MRYKNTEAEETMATVQSITEPTRSLARDFAIAWAELMEAHFESDPMRTIDSFLDENFMPDLIIVGNQSRFLDAGPEHYAMATQLLEECWVHGEAFGAWMRRLENDTSWEVLHLGVQTAGRNAQEGEAVPADPGGVPVDPVIGDIDHTGMEGGDGDS